MAEENGGAGLHFGAFARNEAALLALGISRDAGEQLRSALMAQQQSLLGDVVDSLREQAVEATSDAVWGPRLSAAIRECARNIRPDVVLKAVDEESGISRVLLRSLD